MLLHGLSTGKLFCVYAYDSLLLLLNILQAIVMSEQPSDLNICNLMFKFNLNSTDWMYTEWDIGADNRE